MTEIINPISVLEYSPTRIHLAIYDETNLNNRIFFSKKINFKKKENFDQDQIIFNLITEAEDNLGQHLNELLLITDTSSIHSLDFSIQKNFEKKYIKNSDIDYLIKESENEVKINNKEKDILHIIKFKIFLNDLEIQSLEKVSQEASKVKIELKFILIDKKVCDKLKNLFLKKHITLKKIYCTSFIKSLGLIKKLNISDYNSFIDIGLRKTSLTIFKDKKLLYLNNTHVGGDHITKDISKILNLDYRLAELKKINFFKKNLQKKLSSEDEFLKKVINSRLEEIIEILFLNCPFANQSFFNKNLNLFFIGNGSKVLNENLLSFGPEFNFIKEMSIIDEKSYDPCNSALEFFISNRKFESQKTTINLENKGFFEKLFSYFGKK